MGSKNLILKLKSLSNARNVAGMARFGINPKNTLGIPVPVLRKMAKETGKDHGLAQELWASGIHEARILASMVDDPELVTAKQMDSWAGGFDSWDVCDQVCMNLFSRTAFACAKAKQWSSSKEEFVKRAGFALMACLAVGDKGVGDRQLEEFLPIIEREASDGRNFVKKAVNWALRQIGKRNTALKRKALVTARRILKSGSKSARWIAGDALRELKN